MPVPHTVYFSPLPSPISPASSSPSFYNFPLLLSPSYQYVPVSSTDTTDHPLPFPLPPAYVTVTGNEREHHLDEQGRLRQQPEAHRDALAPVPGHETQQQAYLGEGTRRAVPGEQEYIPPSPAALPPPPPPPPPPFLPPTRKPECEQEPPASKDAYVERRVMLEWLLASYSGHRSLYSLSTLHIDTLRWGLKYVRSRITSLVAQDIVLYRQYRSLLADSDSAQRGFAYAGWSWAPPEDGELEGLDRADVVRLLDIDVGVYDEVNSSVRDWRKSIERRRKEIAEEQRRVEVDGRREILEDGRQGNIE